MIGQSDGLVDHHADEIWPPGLAWPLRSNESGCCSLPSEQTEKTRDECFWGKAPWVLSFEGELKGIDGRGLWIGSPGHEASELSVEASGKQVHSVWPPLPIGQPEQSGI